MAKRILLVSKDETITASLRGHLEKEGYRVSVASTGRTAVSGARAERPKLVIVELASLEAIGKRTYHRLHRSMGIPTILIMEGKRADEGMEAEGYLVKPITPDRLLARVQMVLRGEESRYLEVGDLVLDLESRQLIKGGEPKKLTPKEFKLLRIVMRNVGDVLSRRILIKEVWETDYLGDTRTLDVHICYLRRKVEKNPSQPEYLRTVRGVGYMLEDPSRR